MLVTGRMGRLHGAKTARRLVEAAGKTGFAKIPATAPPRKLLEGRGRAGERPYESSDDVCEADGEGEGVEPTDGGFGSQLLVVGEGDGRSDRGLFRGLQGLRLM